jgi:pimeloyl-ACP methyl ester carboxylesterase
MTSSTTIHRLKDIVKVVLLLFVLVLHGQFLEEPVKEGLAAPFRPLIAKHKNYSKNAYLERIHFQAKKNEESAQTITRKGELLIRKNAPATVLVCHGYMCDKHDISFFRFVFANYNVMTFDFRAHGQAVDGQYCTLGKEEAFDVMGAVSYLNSRPEVANKPIIGYGFSMGAVSAIEAQAKKPLFEGMILDCPFDSSDNLLKKGLNQLTFSFLGYEFRVPGRSLLEKYAYSPYVQSLLKAMLRAIAKWDATKTETLIKRVAPVDSIERIEIPCFFITCKNDEKVSVNAVNSIYLGAKGYKRLWITNGRRHFDSFFYNPEKYVYKVNKFINQVLEGSVYQRTLAKVVADPEDQV